MERKFVKFHENWKKIAISFACTKLWCFFMDFRLQNDPEINAFGSFVCKSRFRENHRFLKVNQCFLGLELPKSAPKSSAKHVRKKGSAKIEFRVDLGSIFGGFGAPKCSK